MADEKPFCNGSTLTGESHFNFRFDGSTFICEWPAFDEIPTVQQYS